MYTVPFETIADASMVPPVAVDHTLLSCGAFADESTDSFALLLECVGSKRYAGQSLEVPEANAERTADSRPTDSRTVIGRARRMARVALSRRKPSSPLGCFNLVSPAG